MSNEHAQSKVLVMDVGMSWSCILTFVSLIKCASSIGLFFVIAGHEDFQEFRFCSWHSIWSDPEFSAQTCIGNDLQAWDKIISFLSISNRQKPYTFSSIYQTFSLKNLLTFLAEAIQQHTTSIHLLYQRDGIATKPFPDPEIRPAINSNRLQSSNDLFSLPDEREV